MQTVKPHDAQTCYRLQSVPGIGKILSWVLLDEMHDITRFPRVQDFVSYCCLVKCAKESAGKRDGTAGTKIGHAGQKYLARLEKKHGQGKALTVLAHKLAGAVYDMLKRDVVFDLDIFLQSEGRRGGEPAASRGHDRRAWQPCAAMRHLLRRRTLMST